METSFLVAIFVSLFMLAVYAIWYRKSKVNDKKRPIPSILELCFALSAALCVAYLHGYIVHFLSSKT
jgi:hypothetical protein